MSVWTHVLGSIRFDGLSGIDPVPDCGKTCTWEDDETAWNECNVPCGSEGSLIISMWESPPDSGRDTYVATIFGDLRDYDDDQSIIDYFNNITNGRSINQAFFTIVCNKARDFVYIDDTFVEIKS